MPVPAEASHPPVTDDRASPRRWSGLAQWRVLDTAFGDGARFLATWRAWRADARRPRMLHYVAVAQRPVPATGLAPACAIPDPTQTPDPATLLASRWHELLPGFHRLSFDDDRVLLTLCVGDVPAMLRAQHFEADHLAIAGPIGDEAVPFSVSDLAKAVARFAHPGTTFTADAHMAADAPDLGAALERQGFRCRPAPAPASMAPGADSRPAGPAFDSTADAHAFAGEFAPAWTMRRRAPVETPVDAPGHCAVVGAGLAGAAVAASLARRGWRVTVLDAGARAAPGASGVPAGVFAPHVSPDDALLSRLTRAGLRMTRGQLQSLLREGIDWSDGGVLERRAPGDDRLPAAWNADGPNASWRATPAELHAGGLPDDATALWHVRAGWARPARLVEAWLARPGIVLRTGVRVASIEPADDTAPATPRWVLRDAAGRILAEADRVVVAAGFESAAFAPGKPLHPVRGQIVWGRMDIGAGLADVLSRVPSNGDGHLIAHVPDAAGAFWLTGATFDRGRTDVAPDAAGTEANLARLARLHPEAHARLMESIATDETGDAVRAWAGVRCASADRRPLVGPIDEAAPHGPWLCTALGSRGLSFAVLCAELLAARWHGEPLPLPAALALALDTRRVGRGTGQRRAGASR